MPNAVRMFVVALVCGWLVFWLVLTFSPSRALAMLMASLTTLAVLGLLRGWAAIRPRWSVLLRPNGPFDKALGRVVVVGAAIILPAGVLVSWLKYEYSAWWNLLPVALGIASFVHLRRGN
jgi:hypothetical protein